MRFSCLLIFSEFRGDTLGVLLVLIELTEGRAFTLFHFLQIRVELVSADAPLSMQLAPLGL